MTARTRIVDNRGIPGLTPSSVEMPTVEIPVNCMCSWSVVKAGIGRACISRARFFNSLCPRIREHQAMAEAARVVAIRDPWSAA